MPKINILYGLFHPWKLFKSNSPEIKEEKVSTPEEKIGEVIPLANDKAILEAMIDFKVNQKVREHIGNYHTTSPIRLVLFRILPISLLSALIGLAYLRDSSTRILPDENPGIQPNSLSKDYLTKLDKEELKIIKDQNSIVNSLSKHLVALSNYAKPRIVHIHNGMGAGTGFIYRADGIIITNHHVVRGNDIVQVTLYDGKQVAGKVVGVDVFHDLAAVKINLHSLAMQPWDLKEFPTLKLAAKEPEVGELVMAIGHPGNLGWSTNVGVVSGKDRRWSNATDSNLIQTDAAINHGNSGGPLLNMQGEIIGLNELTLGYQGYQSIFFSISANTMREIIPQLIQGN